MARKYFQHNNLSLGAKAVPKPNFNFSRVYGKFLSGHLFINGKKTKYYYTEKASKWAHFYHNARWWKIPYQPDDVMKDKGHDYIVQEGFEIEHKEKS